MGTKCDRPVSETNQGEEMNAVQKDSGNPW